MEPTTVLMRSPGGEVKEVEATAEELTPLMAMGWHQVFAPAAAPRPEIEEGR